MKEEPVSYYVENATATLTNDCQLLHSMCYTTIGYQTALVKFKVYKGSMTLHEGSMDACEKTKNASKKFKRILIDSGFPIGCPVKAVSIN